MRLFLAVFSLIALAGSHALADTVTTKDHLSVNGAIVNMSDGVVRLKAEFKSRSSDMEIPISRIESMEFNGTLFNPGAPSKVMGLGSGDPNLGAAAAKAIPGNTIILRSSSPQACDLIGIDGSFVHCLNHDFDRKIVLRIQVGER